MSMSRRAVLQLGALSAAAAAGVVVLPGHAAALGLPSPEPLPNKRFPTPYVARLLRQPRLRPTRIEPDGTQFYDMTMRAGLARIVPGLDTPIFGYNGVFPGPLISVERGTQVQLRMANRLPDVHPDFGTVCNTVVHLHGSASLPQYDGYASDQIAPGRFKNYFYPNVQPARTLWYHDHGLHVTTQNVYSGLAAQYHIHDALERSLLPTQGRYDVALTVTDATFASDGRLLLDDRDHKGFHGEIILVNGKPWPNMKVGRRVYRFRLLNGCLSRNFKLRLSNGDPVTMVATDGGLMPVAQPVTEWRHGGAERYEFLIDFAQYPADTFIELLNDSPENNRDFRHTDKVMRFEVVDTPVNTTDPTNRIPTQLARSEVMDLQRFQATVRRHYKLDRDPVTDLWQIEDRTNRNDPTANQAQTWDEVVASNFKAVLAQPALGAVELWKWENSGGGWNHPLHMHLIDFQILSRTTEDGGTRPPFAYERGPKDTVYVGESETVELIQRFGPHRGRYMVHCHNLPHEDHDMMSQFRVGLGPDDPDPNDPITTDPAQDDPEAATAARPGWKPMKGAKPPADTKPGHGGHGGPPSEKGGAPQP